MQLFAVYRRTLLAAQSPVRGSAVIGVADGQETDRLAQELRVKQRQIEGQQALLGDLQAQLSRKEQELAEMSVKHGNSLKEIKILQTQLEQTRKSLETALAEIEQLKSPKAPAVPAPGNAQKTAAPQTQISVRRACVPKKAQRVLGISAAPLRLAGSQMAATPRKYLAVGSTKVQLIDMSVGNIYAELESLGGPNVAALGVAVSGDTRNLLVGTTEGHLAIYDIISDQHAPRKSVELKGCHGKVRNCGFLGNQRNVFSASTDRALRIWDAQKATAIKTISVASQMVDAAATEDGTMIVTAHQNGKIQIYSGLVGDEQKIGEVDAHTDGCVGLAISRTGNLIVSIGRDDKIAVIDLNRSTSEVAYRLNHQNFFAFQDTSFPAISPDGRLISACSASDGGVYCFDTTTMKFAGSVSSGDATCVFWAANAAPGTPESFELVTGHRSGVVKFWEATETVNKS